MYDAACPYHKPCVARRQSVPFLTLSQVKLTVFFTTMKGTPLPKKKNLPSVLDDVEKSTNGIPFNPAAQTNLQFVVKNVKN